MTHLNYAFAHIKNDFETLDIKGKTGRFKKILALKDKNPDLKIMLSIGGWGAGNFSEMAADENHRRNFCKNCLDAVKKHGLDGIDIDWEYPTSSAAGISYSPKDTDNFTRLMKDLRKVLGDGLLLTFASAASAEYVDFTAVEPYVDFVNIMAYDMATAPKHHSALYESEISGGMTSDKAARAHLAAGMPAHKLVLGMPFYGRGSGRYADFNDFKDIKKDIEAYEIWDEKAQVPYIADTDGTLIVGYDNPRSLKIKCGYIKANGLRGAMYWDYDGDDADGTLRKTVAREILGRYEL